MTELPVVTGWVNYEGFNINLTMRIEDGCDMPQLTGLAETVIRTLVFCARNIQAGNREINFEKYPNLRQTPEDYHDYGHFVLEPHVTAFCDISTELPGKHSLTIHSHTLAQQVLDVWWARFDTLKSLGILDASRAASDPNPAYSNSAQWGNEPEPRPANSPSSASAGQSTNGATLEDGIVIGKMNPSSTKVYYRDGQIIALPVKKIVLAYREGWIYEFWTGLGNNQYPGVKVYKNKKGSDENSNAYISLKPFLEGLQLDPDKKKSSEGNWWIIGHILHMNDKEYFNPFEARAK